MQPDIPSPTLPHPLPFTLTVELPLDMEAECGGQGEPGFKCIEFLSPCREIGLPLAKTLPEPCALDIPVQWGESASPTRVTAAMLSVVIRYKGTYAFPLIIYLQFQSECCGCLLD